MSDTQEMAMREANARAEGTISGLLNGFDSSIDYLKTENGMKFLEEKLQEIRDMLRDARLTN